MKSFLVLLSACLLLAVVQAKSIFEQLEDEVMAAEFKSVDVDKKDKDDMNKDLKRDFGEILEMFTRDEKRGWKMLEKLLNEFVKKVFHEAFTSPKKGGKKEGFGSGSGEGPSSGSGGSSGSGSEGSSSGSGQAGQTVPNNGPPVIISSLEQETFK